MADAGFEASEKLAKIAHQETGFGIWEDKVLKNQFGSRNVYESMNYPAASSGVVHCRLRYAASKT